MAWTGNFKDRIDNLAGLLSPTDDDAIQEWLRDGCYDVVAKAVAKNGEDEAWKFAAKSSAQTSNHIDIDEFRTIAGVVRNSTFATKGKWGLKNKYYDANSIYAATNNNPIWYIDNSKLSIYPAPSVSETANYYYIPEYAITSWNTSTSSIDNFPSEYYIYVAMYAAIQVLHRRMVDSTAPTSPTFEVLPVAPDSPVLDIIASTFSSSLSDASIAYAVATASETITSDVTAFALAPTYTAPTALSLEAFAIYAGTLANLNISATPPANLSAPTIASPGIATIAKGDISGVAAPVYNGGNVIGMLDATLTHHLATQSISDLSIVATPPAVIAVDPVIAHASIDIPDAATVSTNQPTYTEPSTVVTAVIPDTPVIAKIEYSSPAVDDATAPTILTTSYNAPSAALLTASTTAVAPSETVTIAAVTYDSTYTAQSIGAVGDISVDDVLIGNVADIVTAVYGVGKTAGTVKDANITTGTESGSGQPNYTAPVPAGDGTTIGAISNLDVADVVDNATLSKEVDQWWSILTHFIEDEEDMELASSQMQKISTYLQAYSAEIQNSLNTFNKELQIYTNVINQENENTQQTNQNALAVMQKDLQIAQANLAKNQALEQTNQQMEYQVDQANMNKELQREQIISQQAQAKKLQDAIQETQSIIQNNNAIMQKYTSELAVYQAKVNTDMQIIQNNLSKYQAEQQDSLKTADIANTAHLQQAQLDLQVAIRNKDRAQEISLQNAINVMNSTMQNNDSLLKKYQTELTAYQAEVATQNQEIQQNITNSLNTFNKTQAIYQATMQSEMAKFEADVQGVSKDADLTLQAAIQDFTLELNTYQAEVASYQAQVNTEVQEYQANTAKDTQLWQQAQTFALQEHSQRMQDALNVFNEDNAAYQANIQVELAKVQIDAQEAQKEGDLTLQAAIQDYTLDLQRFQAEVTKYQNEVSDQVSEYTQNLQKALQTWTGEQANELQRYQSEMQNALNAFNDDNAEFQAEVQKKLAEYQADIQIAIKNSDTTTQVDITNKAKALEADMADYNAAIQKYQAELQKSTLDMQADTQEAQNKLAKYSADLQGYGADLAVYQADATSKLQKYQADLQADGVSYQWLQDQYNRLKADYERAFAVPQPQQAGV